MVRDREVLGEIRTVHADNLGVYGARKVHAELHRKGIGDTRALERLLPRHFQQLMSSVVSQRLWLLAQIPAIADSGLHTPDTFYLLPLSSQVTNLCWLNHPRDDLLLEVCRHYMERPVVEE